MPGAEQGEQRVAGVARPRDGQRRALGQPGQGPGRERQADLGGRGGGPQHQDRIGRRRRRPGQHDLAVLLDHAVGQRPAVQLAAPHPDPQRAAPAGPVGLPEGVIDRVGHGPARAGQLAQQRVAVEQAERAGHLVLLLEHQPVEPPAGDLVQHVAGVHDLLVGRPDLGSWRRGDPGRRDGLDGVHVPLAAA